MQHVKRHYVVLDDVLDYTLDTQCVCVVFRNFFLVFLFDYFTAFVELYYMQHVILEEMMSDVYE